MTQPADAGLPGFFAQVPSVTVRDPLAQFLGAADEGVLTYRYVDAVRLAGHSCPTVAEAYLMTRHGLRALYGEALPVRGEIDAFLRDARDSGVTGVIASVVQLLTGAAAESGFRGIGAARRFSRQNTLLFDTKMDGLLALRRRDTGQAVTVQLDTSVVPWAPALRALFPKAVAEQASVEELAQFAQLWQEQVRRMLIDHGDDPKMIRVTAWHNSAPAGALNLQQASTTHTSQSTPIR